MNIGIENIGNDSAGDDRQRAADPTAATSDRDAVFRSDISSFLDDALIEQAVEQSWKAARSQRRTLAFRGPFAWRNLSRVRAPLPQGGSAPDFGADDSTEGKLSVAVERIDGG